MIVILFSWEAWGLIYALVIAFFASIAAAAFWKAQSFFVRGFRSGLLLILLLLLAYPLWVLVGLFTPRVHEAPTWLLLEPIAFGVFALLTGSLFAWKSFMRVNFVAANNLLTEDIVKVLSSLPKNLQENQRVVNAFTSMARISWLFANNEFSLVINTVGSSIETLIRAVYPERLKKLNQDKEVGVATMAKSMGLDVCYEKRGAKGERSFTVSYFWRDIRSTYAHGTGLEKVGIRQLFFFNVLKEPSEETAEMSIGLLNVFLKAYPECCKRFQLITDS